ADRPEVVLLAATDPANPYGATLPWPRKLPRDRRRAKLEQGGSSRVDDSADASDAGRGAIRAVGASVILVNGSLAAYLARGDRVLLLFLPNDEPERSTAGRAVTRALI